MSGRDFRYVARVSAAAVVAALGVARTGFAAPLNPAAFTSLGTLAPAAGSYTANTNGTPKLIVGGTTYTGVVVSQGAGLPDVAVFTFANVTIGNGVTLSATGSRPIAILSKGDVTFAGTGNISVAGSLSGGAAGAGLAGFGVDPGPGAGRNGGAPDGAGGGGFGGAGGDGGFFASDSGGVAYGNLLSALQGGSAGGTGNSPFVAIGGSGGGGLEIGAIGTLHAVSSTLLNARGATAPSANEESGNGGGSGGGVLLHAGSFDLPAGGQINAAGGDGGSQHNSGGGGGGGGRVALSVSSFVVGSVGSTVNVAGGAPGSGIFNDSTQTGHGGQSGDARLDAAITTVPAGVVFDFHPAGFNAFTTHDLTVQSGGIAGRSGAYVNTGVVDVQSGGVFTGSGAMSGGAWTVEGGTILPGGGLDLSGSSLVGYGAVAGRVSGIGAATINAVGGTLTLGNANRADAIDFNGLIGVGDPGARAPAHVVLLDADHAVVSDVLLLDNTSLSAPNGTTLRTGATLTAEDNTSIGGVFTNNGTVSGPSGAGQFITFTDDVNGAGGFSGNVKFSDGFSPGNSPAQVSLENAAFDSTTDLVMELGSIAAGIGFDQLVVSGSIGLDGTLDVVLINGFTPSSGNSFLLINGADTGRFDVANLPALAGGLQWQIDQTPTAYAISVVPEPGVAALLLSAALLVEQRRRR